MVHNLRIPCWLKVPGNDLFVVVVVVVVFILKTVLTSIQYPLFLPLQGKETNFRGHRLTQNKVQKNVYDAFLDSVLALTSILLHSFEKDEMLYLFSYP